MARKKAGMGHGFSFCKKLYGTALASGREALCGRAFAFGHGALYKLHGVLTQFLKATWVGVIAMGYLFILSRITISLMYARFLPKKDGNHRCKHLMELISFLKDCRNKFINKTQKDKVII